MLLGSILLKSSGDGFEKIFSFRIARQGIGKLSKNGFRAFSSNLPTGPKSYCAILGYAEMGSSHKLFGGLDYRIRLSKFIRMCKGVLLLYLYMAFNFGTQSTMEYPVVPALIDQHNWHEADSNPTHDSQCVGARRCVVHSQVPIGIET